VRKTFTFEVAASYEMSVTKYVAKTKTRHFALHSGAREL